MADSEYFKKLKAQLDALPPEERPVVEDKLEAAIAPRRDAVDEALRKSLPVPLDQWRDYKVGLLRRLGVEQLPGGTIC
jgi:hypothetical protein